MSTPDRKGLPSASAFYRYALCPGAWDLEQKVPDSQRPPDDQSAETGTAIHAAITDLAVDADRNLAFNEMAAHCLELEAQTFNEVLGGEPTQLLREQRLWMSDPDTLEPLFSGQFDAFASRGDKCLIIDFKTGWTEIPATDNWQLRALVALAAVNNLIKPDQDVFVAIIAPHCSPAINLAYFSPQSVTDAISQCCELIRSLKKNRHIRIPSFEACRYCPGRSICPETQAILAELALTTIKDADQQAIDGATMAWLLDRCAIVERLKPAIYGRAKAMLQEKPDSIPGYFLKPGQRRRRINDVGKVWLHLGPLTISPAVFVSHCSMAITSLTEMLRAATGFRGNKLQAFTDEILEDAVETTWNVPSIQRGKLTPPALPPGVELRTLPEPGHEPDQS